jgi:hypothetical protein
MSKIIASIEIDGNNYELEDNESDRMKLSKIRKIYSAKISLIRIFKVMWYTAKFPFISLIVCGTFLGFTLSMTMSSSIWYLIGLIISIIFYIIVYRWYLSKTKNALLLCEELRNKDMLKILGG